MKESQENQNYLMYYDVDLPIYKINLRLNFIFIFIFQVFNGIKVVSSQNLPNAKLYPLMHIPIYKIQITKMDIVVKCNV